MFMIVKLIHESFDCLNKKRVDDATPLCFLNEFKTA